MRARISFALVGSIVLLGFGSRARADDPPAEDAPSMLRRARVAETVDHDIPKAIGLYAKVFATAGDNDTIRDAALHLMDLLEARGDRAGALELAKSLTDRLVSRLDDAMKRQVHETLARTLPAGSHAKSPLGDVYVLPAPGSASNPAPSPLETKIQAILSRLDTTEEKDRNAVEVDVLSALSPVGRDALPILERVMNDSRPERARFAAQAFAKIGQKDAIAGLVKAVREGDGFARASAIGGLAVVDPSPDASPELVRQAEPLLSLPGLAEGVLVVAVARHLSASECLDRFQRGGPAAPIWLNAARDKDPIVTAERIARLDAPDPAIAPHIARIAGQIGGAKRFSAQAAWLLTTPGLPPVTRAALLASVVRMKATTETVAAVASIAAAITTFGGADERLSTGTRAWSHILDADTSSLRIGGAEDLVTRGVSPTLPVFDNPNRSAAFEEVTAAILSGSTFNNNATAMSRTLYRTELFAVPALWASVERLVSPATTPAALTNAMAAIGQILGAALPPPSEDARWLGFIMRTPQLTPSWMRRAAGRLGDPKLLETARSLVLTHGADATTQEMSNWAYDLPATYRGPGRGAFAIDVLETWGTQYNGLFIWAIEDAEFWPLLAKRLGTYSLGQRTRMLGILQGQLNDPTILLPPKFDALWLAELRRPAPLDLSIVWPFVAAAARSGSPEYVAIFRELLANANPTPSAYLRPMAHHLKDYTDAGRRALILELLSDSKYDTVLTKYFAQDIWAAVNADPEPKALAQGLDGIARSPLAPGNDVAIYRYTGPELREDLVAVFRTMATPGTKMRAKYRTALVDIAKSLHLKEAVPYLLKEYREGQPTAAAALDEIRAFHDRVKTFEGFAGGKDPLTAEIEAATKGSTVELRRIAVFALAATHGAKAVGALLDIARTTADESVRAAAIEMIEKIARGASEADAPKAQTPAPAAMDDAAPSK